MQCTVVPQTTIWSSAEQISAHHYYVQCRVGAPLLHQFSAKVECLFGQNTPKSAFATVHCSVGLQWSLYNWVQFRKVSTLPFAGGDVGQKPESPHQWRRRGWWADLWLKYLHMFLQYLASSFSLWNICACNIWTKTILGKQLHYIYFLILCTIWTKTILYDFICNIFAGEDLYVFGSIVRKLRVEEEGRVVRTSPRPCALCSP